MRQRRTPEFWAEVRRLVERGLSLKKTSQQFGLAYSYLVQKAALEGWKLCYSGRPRTGARTVLYERRRAEIARERTRYDEAEAALQREAEVLVIDVKKAEVLAQKVLATHSTRMKVTFSELVVQTAEDLRSGDVRPKDRALALGALRAVCDRLYGWDKEPDIGALERARSGIVNLELIHTRPEELAEIDPKKPERHIGSRQREQEGQGDGISAQRHGPPATAGDGQAPRKKEDPSLSAKQHVRPIQEAALQRVPETDRQTLGNVRAPSVQQASMQAPPPTPEERRKQELEKIGRLRSEWRTKSHFRAS